jgi:hypothetical protein
MPPFDFSTGQAVHPRAPAQSPLLQKISKHGKPRLKKFPAEIFVPY